MIVPSFDLYMGCSSSGHGGVVAYVRNALTSFSLCATCVCLATHERGGEGEKRTKMG